MFFFVRTRDMGAGFREEMTESERETMTAHVAYWTELAREGVAVVFGPVADPAGAYGIGVYRAESEEALSRLLDADPASELLDVTVTPMAAAVVGAEIEHSG
jgi:uncharacterized protein